MQPHFFVMSVFHTIRTITDLVLSNVQIAGLKLITLYVMNDGPPHLRQLRWLWMTNQRFAIGLWVLCQILALITDTKRGVYVAPNMRTILLCERGSPYANILAIPDRMHTGIPICVRQSPYA